MVLDRRNKRIEFLIREAESDKNSNLYGKRLQKRLKENEKINYERMQKVAEIILKNKNMSLIAMGPIKGR